MNLIRDDSELQAQPRIVTIQEHFLSIKIMLTGFKFISSFEVRHPRCVSNKSNCMVYTHIFKHNYVLGGMLFTIRKAQLHVSATNFDHHQVVQ
jgi:hypothetical protein